MAYTDIKVVTTTRVEIDLEDEVNTWMSRNPRERTRDAMEKMLQRIAEKAIRQYIAQSMHAVPKL